MDFLKYGGIALLIIASLAVFVFAVKSKRVFKTLLLNSFSGIVVLIIINLTSKFTGVHIPLNYWTVGGSVLYGIPSVCLFLLLPMIF